MKSVRAKGPRKKDSRTFSSSAISILGLFFIGFCTFAVLVLLYAGARIFLYGGGKRARIHSYYVNGTRATELVALADKAAPQGSAEYAAILAAQIESASGAPPLAAAAAAKNSPRKRERLLCSTFTSATQENLALLYDNIQQLGAQCDWAIVFYKTPDVLLVDAFRRNLTRLPAKLVFMESAPDRVALLASYPSPAQSLAHLSSPRSGAAKSHSDAHRTDSLADAPYNSLAYPKPLLYLQLLPLLELYDRVWLLDDDVSLDGFALVEFLELWDCAFWPDQPPIVVQPLVNPFNAAYAFLGVQGWAEQALGQGGAGRGNVLAAGTGFIELQAPLMDARFLSWFLRFIVVPMLRPLHILGADWGFDDLFCTAAANYDLASRPLMDSMARGRNVTCAVIVGGSSIRHLDRKALDSAIGKGVKWYLNHEMLTLVMRAFPVFFLKGFRSAWASPFNSTSLHRRATGELSAQCLEASKMSF